MKKRAQWMETKHKSPNRWQLQSLLNVLALLSCLPFCTLATSVETELSSDAILTKVAEGTAKSHAMAYFGLREYRLRNCRFDKEAVALVQVTYHPDSGKELTPLQKSGSSKLLEILEKLIASEIEVGKPTKSFDYDISPANYRALLGGVSDAGGRSCFLIELIPRRKSKYLIKGTAWVDRTSYGIVRLEGITAASVSIWIGTPHITQEFTRINGTWLPSHTWSVSSGFLLGTSELEIQYSNYLVVGGAEPVSPGKIADGLKRQ